jgi:hypothetical protein
MNLTDDQLRESLHARAERIAPPVDVFGSVETRARRIRRRRVGASVAGAVAAVVAVAVVVPTLVTGSPHTNRVGVGGPSPSGSVTPSTSAPSSTQTPTASGDAVLNPATPWPYRGSDKAISAATLNRFQQDWSAKHPGSGAIEPLWGEIYEPSQQAELVFVIRDGDGARWGMAMASPSGTRFVVDQPLAAGTTVLAAAVPGDEVSRLLVVAAPSTTAIRYAPDGVNFTDMATLDPGVAVKALEGDQAIDKIEVLGAGGKVVFEGPAPNAAATSQPANVLSWPTRGTVPSGLTAQMSSLYAASRQMPVTGLVVKELAGGTDAGGTQYVLAQVWTPGDTAADTVGFLHHADGTTELQMQAKLPANTAVAAIDVTDTPIGLHEWLVVVPQPTTGQVLYAADGKTYKPYEATLAGDGPVVIARDPKASNDRVRVLDGDGKTTFDGPAASLLCGVTSCG